MFVLIDAASMTVRHRLEISNKVRNKPTQHIQFAETGGKLFAVASRYYQYVDILEVVADGRLETDPETLTAVDVAGGEDACIRSMAEHPTLGNGILVAGYKFMTAVFVQTGDGNARRA